MRFVPEQTEKAAEGSTVRKGAQLTTETGHYVGSSHFRGDGGFTHVPGPTVSSGTVETRSRRSPATA